MKSRVAMCACLAALLAACSEDEGESSSADPADTDEAAGEEATGEAELEDGAADEDVAAQEEAAGEETDAEETAEAQEPPEGRAPFPAADCRGADPDATVTITSGEPQPETVEIGFGELVRWKNADEEARSHRIVGDDHDRFDSGTMIEGNVFCLYFPSPGEYDYELQSAAEPVPGLVRVTAP